MREPRLEDSSLLLDLGHRILKETPFFLREPWERGTTVLDMRQVVQHYRDTPGWCMVHIWDGAVPVAEGILSGTGLRRTSHIGSIGIGVLKDYWGNGIGRRLMHDLEQRAVQMGLERLSFTVFAENDRARDFYTRLGYREEGVHKKSIRWPPAEDGGWARYSDEVFMAKWIGGST